MVYHMHPPECQSKLYLDLLDPQLGWPRCTEPDYKEPSPKVAQQVNAEDFRAPLWKLYPEGPNLLWRNVSEVIPCYLDNWNLDAYHLW